MQDANYLKQGIAERELYIDELKNDKIRIKKQYEADNQSIMQAGRTHIEDITASGQRKCLDL